MKHPQIASFIDQLQSCPETDLVQVIQSFGEWNYPRGDLFHWVAVLDRFDEVLERLIGMYELKKPQSKPIAVHDKDLIVHILGFVRLLTENCTNRNIYNSFDRLDALLNAFDLDICLTTLSLAYRQAHRIATQKSYRHSFSISHPALFVLAAAWNETALDHALLNQDAADQGLAFKFYRTWITPDIPGPLEQKNTGEGWVTLNVHLDDHTSEQEALERFSKLVLEHEIPYSERFRLLQHVRLAYAMPSKEKLQTLATIRLLSISILACMTTENIFQARLLSKEPGLLTSIVNILQAPDELVDSSPKSAACKALEAIARHRAKTHDVLVALGASLHHGVLYAVLRKISSNFLGSDDYSAEFVESFLSLVGVMMSSTTNGNTMIASGIIPLLLSFLSGPTHRGKLIGKAVTIIDNACYSFHALPNVVEAGGLSTIVHRIKVEVTQVIGNASTPIHIEQATLIKSMLKFILHLLQAFGSADGLRNLIDTHLPATIAQVFENPSAFGNSITAYCIHILAAFVHQEPTSLATLQEQGLTDKFLAMSLEPIPPSSEYIAALPNGFGACCLNGVGLDKVMTANPFKNLFSVLYSETYRRILYENDTASNIGNAVDELMRHQPKLKDLLIAEILHAVESLWTLNKGESAQDVLLLSASNAVNERIEVVFLEGMQSNMHARDFMSSGGLDKLLNIYANPGLPYDFAASSASMSLTNALRILSEIEPELVLRTLLNALDARLEALSAFMERSIGNFDEAFQQADQLTRSDQAVPECYGQLAGIHCMLNLITDICSPLFQAQGTFVPVKVLAQERSTIMQRLARLNQQRSLCTTLHRCRLCVQLSTVFAKHYTDKWTDRNASMPDNPEAKDMVPAFEYLTREVSSSISALFKGMRVIEAATKSDVLSILRTVSQFADAFQTRDAMEVDDLDQQKQDFLYACLCFERLMTMLSTMSFDERNQAVYTVFIATFCAQGSFDMVLQSFEGLLARYAHIGHDNLDAAALDSLKSALETLLGWLKQSVTSKSFHGSSSNSITNRAKLLTEFNVASNRLFLLLKSRSATFLVTFLAHERLVIESPLHKLSLQLVIELFNKEGEEEIKRETVERTRTPIISHLMQRMAPDQRRIDQLVEMGFSAQAASVALTRNGNNVLRAADYLLTHPELNITFGNVPPAAAATAANEAPDPMEGVEPAPAQEPVAAEEPAVATQDSASTVETVPQNTQPKPDEEDKVSIAQAFGDGEFTTIMNTLDAQRNTLNGVIVGKCFEFLVKSDETLFEAKNILIMKAKESCAAIYDKFLSKFDQIWERAKVGGDAAAEVGTSNLLRMHALLLANSAIQKKYAILSTDFVARLEVLLDVDASSWDHVPSWKAPAFLVYESYLALDDEPPVVKPKYKVQGVGPAAIEASDVRVQLTSKATRDKLLDICLTQPTKTTDRNELLAIMQLVVRLTRVMKPAKRDEILQLLLTMALTRTHQMNVIAMIIMRHMVESEQNLLETMKRGIAASFPKPKWIDVNSFVRNNSQIVLRNPELFVTAAAELCALSNYEPEGKIPQISLRMNIDEQEPVEALYSRPDDATALTVISALVEQLFTLCEEIPKFGEGKKNSLTKSAFVLQALAELVSSYPACQLAVASLPHETRHKLFGCLLSQLLFMDAGQVQSAFKDERKASISTCTVSVLVAFCTAWSAPVERPMFKELDTFRVATLDEIVKTIAAQVESTETLTIKYNRLMAMGELCAKLISACSDDAAPYIGRLLFERKLGVLLVDVLADIDFDHPMSTPVLLSIIKALELLSKMASKVFQDLVVKEVVEGDVPKVETGEEETPTPEAPCQEEEEETPDLYQHSTLGMLEQTPDVQEEDFDEFDDYDDEDMDDMEESDASAESDDGAMDGPDIEVEVIAEEPFDEGDEHDDDEGDPMDESGSSSSSDGDGSHSGTSDGESASGHEEGEQQGHFAWETLSEGSEGAHDDEEDDHSEDQESDNEEEGFIDNEDIQDAIDITPHAHEEFMEVLFNAESNGEPPIFHIHAQDNNGIFRRLAPMRAVGGTGGEMFRLDLESGEHPQLRNFFGNESYVHPLLAENQQQETLADRNQRRAGRQRTYWRSMETLLSNILDFYNTGQGRTEVRPGTEAEADAFAGLTGDQSDRFHCIPLITSERWQQEARLLFGEDLGEHADSVVNALYNALIPGALEEQERKRKAKELADQEKAKQEQEAAETESKRQEEEQAAAAAREEEAPSSTVDTPTVETSSASATTELGPNFILIAGQPVDISASGIDPSFFEGLPDDIRLELLRDYGAPLPVPAPVEDNAIDDDFLQALPPELRRELLSETLQATTERRPVTLIPSGLALAPLKHVKHATLEDVARENGAKPIHLDQTKLVDAYGLGVLVHHMCICPSGATNRLQKIFVGLIADTNVLTEVLKILLWICGLAAKDTSGFSRHFAHLSVRPSVASQKDATMLDNYTTFNDAKRKQIMQRCLEFLNNISGRDPTSSFFLAKHSFSSIVYSTGKSVEKEEYPIVRLLDLLAIKFFREQSSLLEMLTALISLFLKPLVSMASKKSEDVSNLPHLPSESVQMVVQLLASGECSSKTFQSVLSAILHMSHVARLEKILFKALGKSLGGLCEQISKDLTNLLAQLETYNTVSELDRNLVSELSSPASPEASLLRVLKAIDYLTSQRSSTQRFLQMWSDVHEGGQATAFQSIWKLLDECLTRLGSDEERMKSASVVLPLVESLMVVFKLGLTKGESASKSLNHFAGFTDSAHAREQFVHFTETHRKILNALVRGRPSLMSGSFALLIQNPQMLEFDNKRNYFNQQLHKRSMNMPHYSSIQLNVRRQHVFEDSFHQLQSRKGEEIKFGKLNIRFYDEEGVDAGGVTREWFQVLARQMFNPDYVLFKNSQQDQVTFQPNSDSFINPDHLSFFKFIGRIMGKAVYEQQLLDCYFTRSFYKHILGVPVDYKDMEAYDMDMYKNLKWILDNDMTDMDYLTFCMDVESFGERRIVELKENGSNIAVTNDNKAEYVRLVSEYKLTTEIRQQLDAFLTGFQEIIPKNLISIFNEQELELLVSGLPDIDVDDWKNFTDYHGGFTSTTPQIQWFWRAVRSFTQEERAKLLQFVTGTSKVPLGGFGSLQGSGGVQRFQIHKDYASIQRLPSAHTCFNQLDVPMYESYDQLRKQLLLAIQEGSTGFGFS